MAPPCCALVCLFQRYTHVCLCAREGVSAAGSLPNAHKSHWGLEQAVTNSGTRTSIQCLPRGWQGIRPLLPMLEPRGEWTLNPGTLTPDLTPQMVESPHGCGPLGYPGASALWHNMGIVQTLTARGQPAALGVSQPLQKRCRKCVM